MDAAQVRRKLMEVAGGDWEVAWVTNSSFMVVGQEAIVDRMSEADLLAASGAVLYLHWWSSARGTFLTCRGDVSNDYRGDSHLPLR